MSADATASDGPFLLSEEFIRRVQITDVAAFRHLRLNITYRLPDSPSLLQEMNHAFYDRLDIALENLCIIRAALENPNIAGVLLDFIQDRESQSPMLVGHQDNIESRVSRRLREVLNGEVSGQAQEAIASLIQETDMELNRIFTFVTQFPDSFRLNFEGGTVDQNLANLEFAPETAHFIKLKKFLSHWVTTVDGPLHSVDILPAPLASTEEIQEASEQIGTKPIVTRNVGSLVFSSTTNTLQ